MLRYLIEAIGWFSAGLMLAAYLLLTRGKITGHSGTYHWLNVVSGSGFIINSGWNGAYPSASINVVWVLIGIYGLVNRTRSKTGGAVL